MTALYHHKTAFYEDFPHFNVHNDFEGVVTDYGHQREV